MIRLVTFLLSPSAHLSACASIFLVLVFSSLALADTYSWTDGEGVVHFTDDPQKAPAKAQRSENYESEVILDAQDIVGCWSNRKDSFGTLSAAFRADKTGEMVNAIGLSIPFDWLIRVDGRIELELREPPGLWGSPNRPARRYTLAGEYDRDRDVLLIRDEKKKGAEAKLFPEDDYGHGGKGKCERRASRVHAPKYLIFEKSTVRDSLTGITWARDLDITGSMRKHRNAQEFLAELNNQGYGGTSDWRLPSREEMQRMVDVLLAFSQQRGRSSTFSNISELLRWVGFTNPKLQCYWTSTEGKLRGERYAYSLAINGQQSFGHQETCGIWPVSGR